MSNVIEISNLEFDYQGLSQSRTPLLKIPAFSLEKSKRLFLQGESGSGKSTFLSLVTGILKPQGGSLIVLGQDFSNTNDSNRDHIRGESMGYIFQLFNLIPYLNVEQNIQLPCRLFRKRMANKSAHELKDETRRLASHLGIGALLKDTVANLSVGQQQRVAACRALMGSPELIIADEPTSALDHAHREKFIELLMTECSAFKTSLLFVSHDPTLAGYFDLKINLKDINFGQMSRDETITGEINRGADK